MKKLFFDVLEIIIVVFALSWFIKSYFVGFTLVDENGMRPTLTVNDCLYEDKFLYKSMGTLERGDIVVIMNTSEEKEVKRLIGLPGDKVEIKNGYTFINGEPTYEPYTQNPVTYKFPAVIVPSDSLFVLNDNREDLNDSRTWGSIPKDELEGKAVFRFWPLTRINSL